MALPTKLLEGFTLDEGAVSTAWWGPVAWSDVLGIGVQLSGSEVAADLATYPGAQSTTDGTSFTTRTIPQEVGSVIRIWQAVGVDPSTGHFVAVGVWMDGSADYRLSVAYSADGESWALGSVSGAGILGASNGLNEYCGLAFGGGLGVLSSIPDDTTGKSISLVTDDGGVTWTAADMDDVSSVGPTAPAWSPDDALFIAVGADPTGATDKHFRYTSALGVTWTKIELSDNTDVYYGVAYDSATPQLVVYGAGGVWTGTTISALARTALASPSLERLWWFGVDVGYVGTQQFGAVSESQWWQSSDLAEWTAGDGTGQVGTLYLAYATAIDKVIGGFSDSGSGPLAGGTVLLSEITGSAPTVITGLAHLEGESVSVTGDGVVLASPLNPLYTPIVVSGGTITLPAGTYTRVVVGLPFVADVETLDIDRAGSSMKDAGVNVKKVGLWLEESMTPFVAQSLPVSDTSITGMQQMPMLDEDENVTTDPITGYRNVGIDGAWTNRGRIALRHVDPTPLSVLAIVASGDFGRG